MSMPVGGLCFQEATEVLELVPLANPVFSVFSKPPLRPGRNAINLPCVKLLFENLPPSLAPQRETLTRCLEAMNRVMPVRKIYLFGSHARGDARPDSDVDLCIVADGASRQLEAAQSIRREMRPIPSKPSFTLVPITPERLLEKKSAGDFFFKTILREGVLLAAQD